ncbi:MAG: hypothetical protein IJS15_00385 [Victivallales bacterium]|nr:hypothetical protein [Victivallales bacterium]
MINAAFAECDITPEIGDEIPGGFSPRISTGIIDPLMARAVAFRNPNQGFIVIGADAVSLRFETVEAARMKISAACGIPPRHILICASHTHCGGPANSVLGTEKNDLYLLKVIAGLAEAAINAWNNARPATLQFGKKDCPGWGFNRRWVMKDGQHRTNPGKLNPDMVRPAGPTDPDVSFLLVKDSAGRPIGAIGNFTCHSTVFWEEKFTPDYCHYWQKALRNVYGEKFILVFLNGACGDINQIDFTNADAKEYGLQHAISMGEALAKTSIEAIESAPVETEPTLRWAGTDVELPLRIPSEEQLAADKALAESDSEWASAKWQARDRLLLATEFAGKTATLCPVDVYQIGKALFAASSWQPFCEFGLRLKQSAPERVAVAMLANGNVGYIPTEAAFVGGGYEPTLCRGSHHAPNAGDIITEASLELLRIFEQ